MSARKMLYAATVLAVAFNVVRAEEADEDELDESRQRLRALSTKTIFPETHPNEAQITAGKPVKALVKFENNAETTYNLEFISAHLASTQSASLISQNLTGALVNRTVNQGETVSMEYSFAPFKDLEPKEYRLVLQVHFMSEDDNERNSLAAFNETVFIADGSSLFDVQGLFLALLVIGVFGFLYARMTGKKFLKSQKGSAAAKRVTSTSPAPEVGAKVSSDDIDMSYVSNQHIKAARARSGSPKKRN